MFTRFARRLVATIVVAAMSAPAGVVAATPGPHDILPPGVPLDPSELLNAGLSLLDVDPFTGQLGALPGAGAADAVIVDQLVDTGQLAAEALRASEQARLELERRKRLDDARRRLASVRDVAGIPAVVVDAANRASQTASCAVKPEVLLGFFKAEAGSLLNRVQPTGWAEPPIVAYQPMATGDTDGGRVDGDASKDWATGPAQFAPPAWTEHGVDGDGDGVAHTQNVYDAAGAMASLLCHLAARRQVSLSSDDGIYLVAGDYTNGPYSNWQANSRQAGYARKKLDLVREIRAELTAAHGMVSPQTVIGPGGCPTQVPGNTLRGSAAGRSPYDLCRRSVEQAPTPEAAQAIIFAFQNLGVPYSKERRNSEGWFDCSSYVTRAFRSAGLSTAPRGQNAPTTHTMLPHSWGVNSKVPWSVVIGRDAARPGDMVFPHSGHVMILLVDGLVIHSPRTGDVTHVRDNYASGKPGEAGYSAWPQYRRVDPSRAR